MSDFVLLSGPTLPELLRGLGNVFPLETQQESVETVVYRDTFDWQLYKAGLTLTTSPAGRHVRVALSTQEGREVESILSRDPHFATDLPPGPLLEVVASAATHRRLLPRARGEWKGTLVAILNEDGKTVVRLLFREGVAIGEEEQGNVPLPLRIHPLPLKGYRSEEKKVVSLLRKRFSLKGEARTEQEAVYDALGLTPGDYSSSFTLELSPEMPAAEATRRIHRALLDGIQANEEGVIRDWDSEFLHDFRVAVRRTRSALTQIKGVFPPSATDHFTKEFRWLGSRTGPTRDLDVYLLKIPAYRAALPRDAREDLEPLLRLLRKKRRLELRRLRQSLRSKRYRRLMEEWERFLEPQETEDAVPPSAQLPVKEVASERILKAYKRVLKKGGKIGNHTSASKLHRLRIDCKKVRYLITFFQSLYPPEALKPFIKELKRLQDHLGDFNDLQVQREALQEFAEEMMAAGNTPPATLLAMGQLLGKLEEQQLHEREAFHERFKRFSRSKNRKRFGALFESGSAVEGKESKGKGSP